MNNFPNPTVLRSSDDSARGKIQYERANFSHHCQETFEKTTTTMIFMIGSFPAKAEKAEEITEDFLVATIQSLFRTTSSVYC